MKISQEILDDAHNFVDFARLQYEQAVEFDEEMRQAQRELEVFMYAALAQSVERLSEKQRVTGSNPVGCTF